VLGWAREAGVIERRGHDIPGTGRNLQYRAVTLSNRGKLNGAEAPQVHKARIYDS